MRMTSEARAALSRRGFLKGSGALVVAFSLRGLRAQVAGSPPPGQVDSWLAIAADGSVTAYSGKEEIGQGIATAQQQLVAEELCVPFERVTLIYCDTALAPDQAHTSGSQSHPANFKNSNLAQACATAREALLLLASQRMGVPVDELTASGGAIQARGDASKRVTYGELVGGRRFSLAVDRNARRKPVSEWAVLGKPVPRPDLPALVTGEFEFVHNVRLPGMLHGKVVRPPRVGAVLARVDEESVRGMPGLVRVVVKRNFVGVVAEKPWQAQQIAEGLRVEWTGGTPLPDQSRFYESLRSQPARDTMVADSGGVPEALAGAARVLRATYLHPYQMHGSLGSSCAVADIRGEGGTLYSATQGVWYQKQTAAMVLGLKPENIRVIFKRGSGCYGLNGADTVTYDAALLSQAVERPVRVQLSRRDEMAWENFGYAFVIDQTAGLDEQGNIVAWDHESWAPTLGNRPGANQPGNVITGYLVGFEPAPFQPRSPAPPPGAYNNNQNAVPSYLAVGTGTVRRGRVLTHNTRSPLWTGPLRSPWRLQNTFAHESFMDELAVAAGADPVAYRVRHLRDPRLIETLQAAARAAGWEARPSPRPGNARTGVVSGRGAASCLYEGNNGYTAMVVEVEVNQDTGAVAVKRIFAASDTGPISNPDGLRNQVEGGALQGLSRALLEEVTWDNEKVTSFDWRTYRSLPLGFDVPEIQTVLIHRTEGEAMGAGETSITVIAAALGNAIFDATGARVRQLPFTPERVKAALEARA
jgi:nicotinate dehydrogenase subunit B